MNRLEYNAVYGVLGCQSLTYVMVVFVGRL